ncbi:carbamoyltransferase [Paenibacillus tundrae]|uniref:carbamoyltransferase family protein n=1 Tax=Paenibacillus tundrae TaxID=528187 RepID=UPI0022A92C53|nr:carbamoyltransferase C-terminal domain-containing protein [Paenibacillus tundrae]MCZ1264768.1 hypothetical protein [Paenibacillus tundrae]
MIILGYSGLHNAMNYVKTNRAERPGEEKMVQGLDSAAALIIDGKIVACAEEERFNYEKQTCNFPLNAISYCLTEAGITIEDVDIIAHGFNYEPFRDIFLQYDKEMFDEIYSIENQKKLWHKHFDITLDEKNFIPVNHHLAHAASSFFPSGFKKSLCFVCDAMGENKSSTMFLVDDGNFKKLSTHSIKNSIGILYSIVTYHLGYEFNADEYKVMGLASYGNPEPFRVFFDTLIHYHEYGKIEIDWEQFGIDVSQDPFHRAKLEYLEKNIVHPGDGENMDDLLIDFAAAAQEAVEKVFAHILSYWKGKTEVNDICMAGGVLLNCKNNGKIINSQLFENIYVQPAAGDNGTALGAALYVSNLNNIKISKDNQNEIPFYGPSYNDGEYMNDISKFGDDILWTEFKSFEITCKDAASEVAKDNIIGWFQGRMEYGPRALGARSIVANPMSPDIKQRLNSIVKFRESFRPFAPISLKDKADRYFEFNHSRIFDYMLATCTVKPEYRDKLIGITHIDGSARLQLIDKENKYFYELLKSFSELTGTACMINTSFNVKGQPIICSPELAIKTFLRINMNALYIGNYKITKKM